MAEQPVNLSTVLYLGVFSRAEQRVLQAIFKAIAIGLLKKTERRSYCAVSLANILTYGKAPTAPQPMKLPLCQGELTCTPIA
jgi:hypothetical protein